MNIIRTLIATSLLVVIHGGLLAQGDQYTVDELFDKARKAAFENSDYEEARTLAFRALERSPDYHDIRVFVGRTYAWEGSYSSARRAFNYVLERDRYHRQALLAMIDVETWSGQYSEALKWCETALEYFATDAEFLMQKASLLETTGDPVKAESVYTEILELHPGNVRARNSLQQIRLARMKNKVSLSYRHDQFREIFDPWDFIELQLNRRTGLGSVIGRVQYANRFSTDAVQFNVDAYPTITEGLYAYLNLGYSPSSIFPRFRLGTSLYKSLPAAFEAEAGFRYLDFVSSDVWIYTVSLSKYYGNYLFTGRSYFVPSGEGNSHSFSLLIRRYLSGSKKYIGISSGFGSASEEIRFEEDIQRLDSWFINVEAQFPVSPRVNIGGNAGYDSEEFTNFTRDRFSFTMYVSYRF